REVIAHGFFTRGRAPGDVALERNSMRLPRHDGERCRQGKKHRRTRCDYPAPSPQEPAEHIQPRALTRCDRLGSQIPLYLVPESTDALIAMLGLLAQTLADDRIEVALEQTRGHHRSRVRSRRPTR